MVDEIKSTLERRTVSTVALMATIRAVLTISDSTISNVRTLRRWKFLRMYLITIGGS